MTFEQSMKRLEQITEKMEQKELSLDEAMEPYREGKELLRLCSQKLDTAAQLLEDSQEEQ